MPNIEGIQNIRNRIQSIEDRINTIKTGEAVKMGGVPFDANLKMAMGDPGMMQVGYNTGPSDLQSLMNYRGYAQMGVGGTSIANQRLADVAKTWEGKEFKPGQRERCADFVSTMIEQAGIAPMNFKHEVNCWELQKQGRMVDKKELKAGDVVYFGYTYMPTDYTHVGIYLGDGKFVHRPTASRPVVIDNLDTGYYAEKFCGARRLHG